MICDICHREADPAEAHWLHVEECPGLAEGIAGTMLEGVICDCDYSAHPECCPECNPAMRRRLLRDHRHDVLNTVLLGAVAVLGALLLLIEAL